ncbi:Protein FAM136A, partial [Mucuna pruriens]
MTILDMGADLIVDSEYQMDRFGEAEEQIASRTVRQKLEEVNVAAQTILAPVQDHVNFTLQRAYFKCAYECFDRSRRQEDISNCVENCSIPLSNVQQTFENEMAKFQERLNRSLMVCQDKYEAARLQQKSGAVFDLVSCADQSIQESIKTLPHLANKLKASFGISDNNSI